jgi:cysteinyl-tRNA synthetase
MSMLRAIFVASLVATLAACQRRPLPPNSGGAPVDAEGVHEEGRSADGAAPPDAKRSEGGTMLGPGFPERGPWASFYGNAAQMGDLSKAMRAYRILNIDADPGVSNFTDAQIHLLRAGGKNRVLSYLNLGACETFRTYWSTAPGFVPCSKNTGAHRGPYEGYADETWMNLGDPAYQALILGHVAARIAARGVDGFYLDNMELVEHSSTSKNGPCDAACRQGGLDLVRRLREAFPQMILVMQNATGETTRLGTTGGVAFPGLLDGIAHEEVYQPHYDQDAERELLAWKAMGMHTKDGRPFWIAVEDYVGRCANRSAAGDVFRRARARDFSAYASDASGGQKVLCFWEP